MYNTAFTIQYAQDGRLQYYNFEAGNPKEFFGKSLGSWNICPRNRKP